TGRQLCRIENFIPYDKTMARVASGAATLNLLGMLMNEPAVLFKEKINFKLPGGNGFTEHQDAPAFTTFGHDYHITMMLSIDASTVQNGCLEVVPGGHRSGLLTTEPDLTIACDLRDDMAWTPVPTLPGDLLFFDSYLPHRSGPNRSNVSRRALYATYNRAAQGDVRERYFAAKREAFPPEVEKIPGKEYPAGVFNVGNPVN
ncbi:MAG TPA: phytanoyl-CoA dioxygenase family protein, partial [Pseudomonadales bacterium]|nr:phytanoyl-CoA dioxygenase family protein [Pseudomonadales bacterium]